MPEILQLRKNEFFVTPGTAPRRGSRRGQGAFFKAGFIACRLLALAITHRGAFYFSGYHAELI